MNENTTLMNSKNGLIEPTSTIQIERWEQVKDAVDYPVHIVNAFYHDDEKDGYVNANGETNTGREKYFNLIVVDKFRNGDKQAISTVTGMYGTVLTKSVYESLYSQLMGGAISHKIISLYVTGNGGAQELVLEMNDMNDIDGLPDAVVMRIKLNTSVDGSKSHSLSMMVHNKTGDVSTHVYGGEYKFSARHTTTIEERTINFIPFVNKMIEQWNDVIIPMMNIIYDRKFNREVAIGMIEKIGDSAGVGKGHIENIVKLYQSPSVRTNDTSDSLYRINTTFGQYFDDELVSKHDRANQFKDGVAKAIEAEATQGVM